MNEAVSAFLRRGEEQGCLTLAELEELVEGGGLTDDDVDELCEELEVRGIRLTDECMPGTATRYRGRTLAAATTDAMQLFLRDVDRYPLLSAEEELKLAQRSAEGDQAAKDRLVKSNLRLVVSIARRHQHRGLSVLDLVQEGILGLIKAVDRYDWRRGFRISTYATWSIRNAINAAIDNQARAIRIPAEMARRERQLRQWEDELRSRLGRHPTDRELAQAAGLSGRALRALREGRRTIVSLDHPPAASGETALIDLVAAEGGDSEETVEINLSRDSLHRSIDELPGREGEVLRLRYGLGEQEPMTLAEIGRALGLTAERIRQIEVQALSRLALRREVQALWQTA
jgi:RNA polymerase primary sigma factor